MNQNLTMSSTKLIFLFLEEKSKVNNKFTLPVLKEIFSLFYSIFSFVILPIFGLNYYVFNVGISIDLSNSYLALLFIFFSSCSSFYVLFMVSWNIYHVNRGNIFKLIFRLIKIFRSLSVTDFYSILLSIIPLIVFILLNMLELNVLFYFLGLTKGNAFVYIYTRICLLPFILYINNIIFYNIKNILFNDTTNINYSLFSPMMCESFTISRLIWMSFFISIFYLGSTPILDTSKISVESRPAVEIPAYSDAATIYYMGTDYSELSAHTRRLVEQFTDLPVDIPTETKATQWSVICKNNPMLVPGQSAVIGVNVPNVRGPIMLTYGSLVFIDPSVFIQNDVIINDTPVTRIVIGKNSVIAAGCYIVAVGHDLDVETRSNPISKAKSYGRDIIIGQGVFIGTGSRILAGTVLGDFSVVKAGSVVNGKVIPPHYTTDGVKMWPSSKKFS